MIEVPNEKAITGLTRTELIALVYALKKERDEAVATWEDHECPLLPASFDGETR